MSTMLTCLPYIIMELCRAKFIMLLIQIHIVGSLVLMPVLMPEI